MDRPVAFADLHFGKTGALKLSVDVAGEYECAMPQALADPAQDLKTGVRHGAAVELQPMPVETPGKARFRCEGGWIGNLLEGNPRPSKRRVSPPETLRTAKIGEAGVDPDACTGGDQQPVGLGDQFGATLVIGRQLQSPRPRRPQMGGVGVGDGIAHLPQQALLVDAQGSLENQPV